MNSTILFRRPLAALKLQPGTSNLQLVLVVLLTVCTTVLAVPPPNDTCDGALVVPSTGPFPYYTPVVDMREAGSGDPAAPACSLAGVRNGVWYRFTPAVSGLYTLSARADTETTVFDTVMAIYTAPGCGGPYQLIACNDDDLDEYQSAISLSLNADTTYYIVLWMSSTSPDFFGTLAQLKVSHPVPPVNDTSEGAEIIPAGGPFPYLSAITDTTLATTAGDPPAPYCLTNAGYRSVWYRFTPETSATYAFSLGSDTRTTLYNVVLAAYTASDFVLQGCSRTTFMDFDSTLSLRLAAGTTYYLVAWEPDAPTCTLGYTSLQLGVSRLLVPSVSTSAPTNISSGSAVLRATVNPNGAPTTAWFEWGPTASYGNTTPLQSLGSGLNALPLSATISAHLPQLYHFRAVATNNAGPVFGADALLWWDATRRTLSLAPANNGWRLLFSGNPGQTYSVQVSTNLADWSTVGNATDAGSGSFQFDEPAGWGAPARFYRLFCP